MKTTSILLAASCLMSTVLLGNIARAERFIDTFQSALPLQTLPGTSTPTPALWVGTLAGSSKGTDLAVQTGLPGVYGGSRDATLFASSMSNQVFLTSTKQNGRYELSYAAGTGTSGRMRLEYGAAAQMNADLISDGSVAFEFEVEGDMDNSIPYRPVQLTITVESGGGAVVKQKSVTVLNDGVYQVPFTSFPGINFSDVDAITFDFDASAVSAVDYILVGGIRTTAAPCTKADIMLDSFDEDLPLRTLPGAGTYPIMWVGTINGTSLASDTATQSGLFGTIGGQRKTTLVASSLSNFITTNMSDTYGTPTLSFASAYPTSGRLTLEYGAQAALNANLSSAKAFEFELDGDLNSGSPRPVPLTVTVVSGALSRSSTVTLLNNGMYYVPFTSFPSVNWADVDRVTFSFNATQVQAVDYDLIGGLRAAACTP